MDIVPTSFSGVKLWQLFYSSDEIVLTKSTTIYLMELIQEWVPISFVAKGTLIKVDNFYKKSRYIVLMMLHLSIHLLLGNKN